MSIPESVVERVRFKNANTCESMEDAERRARRVILALAENLPDSAVRAALDDFAKSTGDPEEDMRAAIIAALKDVAGEAS